MLNQIDSGQRATWMSIPRSLSRQIELERGPAARRTFDAAFARALYRFDVETSLTIARQRAEMRHRRRRS